MKEKLQHYCSQYMRTDNEQDMTATQMYPKQLEFLLYGIISVFLIGEVPSFIPTDVASACSLCHVTQSNPFFKMAAAKNKNDDMELTRIRGRGILEARAQEENVTGERNDIQEISTFIPGAMSTPTPTFIPGATSTLIPAPPTFQPFERNGQVKTRK